jgi:CHAD domain-containing protein
MSAEILSWTTRPEASIEGLRHRLEALGATLEAGSCRRVCWLDSFDDRLFGIGEAAALADGRLERRGLDGTVLASVPAPGPAPWRVPALPPELRTAWMGVLGQRALLPRVETEHQLLTGSMRIKGKHAGYLVVELGLAWRPGTVSRVALPAKVRFEPSKKLKRVRKALALLEAALPARDEAAEGPVALARTTIGATAPSRLGVPLHREARADASIKAILRQVFSALRANEAGLLAGLDLAFNEDFRAAVQRTESVLTHLSRGVPTPIIDRFGPEFGWLAAVTEPLRDLDGCLQALPGYSARRSQPALAPLAAQLSARQAEAHADVITALTSPRYRALVDGWQAWLSGPVPDPLAPAWADHSVLEVARRQVLDTYTTLLAEGAVVEADALAACIGPLWVRSRQLRALLEFFRTLFPPTKINQLISALKLLQQHLDAARTLAAHQQVLGSLAPTGIKHTDKAVARLNQQLASRQAEACSACTRAWAQFDAQSVRATFAELFA